MTELGVVRRNITRADRDATDRLAQFGATTVHGAMGRTRRLKPCMRPIYPAARVAAVAEAAAKREANETDKRARLGAGVLGPDPYGMRDAPAEAGLRYVD